MNKKLIIYIASLVFLIIMVAILNISNVFKEKTNTLEATILSKSESTIVVKDDNDVTYTFKEATSSFDIGSRVLIEYTGLLNKDASIKIIKLVEGKDGIEKIDGLGSKIDAKWLDNGIFGDYYTLAFNRLKTMSQDEKIAQLLLVKYPDSDAEAINLMKKYQFGGYVFFEKEFSDKTREEVKMMIDNVQNAAEIPILTAVDEEGGTVVRVSSNTNLRSEKFKSPSELYSEGQLEAIKNDTIEKSQLLNDLGLNVNLAPVVDISTSDGDYMYSRSLQQNEKITSDYAKTVIEASRGTGVSYTLKHFPGYGNNADTHTSSVTDNRSYDDILKKDVLPFEAGIDAGAEAVLVSHNIVKNIDSSNPASLSATVHDLLRYELNFTGVIMTDDLSMRALSGIDDVYSKAIKAGNDILIIGDYDEAISDIKNALNNGSLKEEDINRATFRILAWKYSKGLIYDNQK